jgi:hypothetical protein
MKRRFLLIAFFILSFSCSQAQYQMAIGALFGKLNNGVTFKYLFNEDEGMGLEFQAYSSLVAAQRGYTVKGFLNDEIPFKIAFLQLPLDFIGGGGFQVGYFPYSAPGYYKIVDGNPDYYGKSVVTLGVAANIGIEYKVRKRNLPLAVGVDAVPSYDFVHPGPDWFDFGVNIRYYIR